MVRRGIHIERLTRRRGDGERKADRGTWGQGEGKRVGGKEGRKRVRRWEVERVE
jgi:hypothetical protein